MNKSFKDKPMYKSIPYTSVRIEFITEKELDFGKLDLSEIHFHKEELQIQRDEYLQLKGDYRRMLQERKLLEAKMIKKKIKAYKEKMESSERSLLSLKSLNFPKLAAVFSSTSLSFELNEDEWKSLFVSKRDMKSSLEKSLSTLYELLPEAQERILDFSNIGMVEFDNYPLSHPLAYSFVLRPSNLQKAEELKGNDGTFFFHLLKPSYTKSIGFPLYAIIYVCQPTSSLYKDADSYLEAVKSCAKCMIKGLRYVNNQISKTVLNTSINVIRQGFSHGYNLNQFALCPDEISLQILKGYQEELASDDAGILSVQFENSFDFKLDQAPFQVLENLSLGWD